MDLPIPRDICTKAATYQARGTAKANSSTEGVVAAAASRRRKTKQSPFVRLSGHLASWLKDKHTASGRGGAVITMQDVSDRATEMVGLAWEAHMKQWIHLEPFEVSQFRPGKHRFKASASWTYKWLRKNELSHCCATTPPKIPLSDGGKTYLCFDRKINCLTDLERNDSTVWCIKDIQIGDAEGEYIATKLIYGGKNCVKLVLANNQMTFNAFDSITRALQNRPDISSLLIYKNKGIRGASLPQHRSWLYQQPFSDEAGSRPLVTGSGLRSTIAARLAPHLTQLALWDCELDDSDIHELCELFYYRSSPLQELLLTSNRITSTGVNDLARALLQNNNGLEVLSLDDNRGVDDSAAVFCTMLQRNTRLSRLHLNRTNVGDTVCLALALNLNSNMTDIMIGRTEVTDKGVEWLMWLYQQAGKLKSLKLAYNKIGLRGIRALVRACKQGIDDDDKDGDDLTKPYPADKHRKTVLQVDTRKLKVCGDMKTRAKEAEMIRRLLESARGCMKETRFTNHGRDQVTHLTLLLPLLMPLLLQDGGNNNNHDDEDDECPSALLD